MTRGAAIRLAILLIGPLLAYAVWSPGVETTDGRFDRGRNGLWLAHGWLGGTDWFVRNDKPREPFESPAALDRLGRTCRENGVAFVYPHLCPADAAGSLPECDPVKLDRLAEALPGVAILPWVGGVFQSGINAGLIDLGPSTGGFTGVAIYADWTTSDAEWDVFRRQFRRQ